MFCPVAATTTPNPEINTDLDSSGTVLVTEEFYMECVVLVDLGTRLHMEWAYPARDEVITRGLHYTTQLTHSMWST